jgi:hypothetical protein
MRGGRQKVRRRLCAVLDVVLNTVEIGIELRRLAVNLDLRGGKPLGRTVVREPEATGQLASSSVQRRRRRRRRSHGTRGGGENY